MTHNIAAMGRSQVGFEKRGAKLGAYGRLGISTKLKGANIGETLQTHNCQLRAIVGHPPGRL